MKPLKIYQPWMPWWLAAPIVILYIIFAVLLFRDLDQRNEMVRVMIPPWVLLGALVLPAAINARSITVSSQGVRLRNVPIPMGKNYDVGRDAIRSCTIRVVRTKLKHGEETTYIVGVESDQGQIDLAYPYSKYDDAKLIAEQVIAALNQGAVLHKIGFEWANREPEGVRKRRVTKALLWGGAFVAAILLGGYWEVISSAGH